MALAEKRWFAAVPALGVAIHSAAENVATRSHARWDSVKWTGQLQTAGTLQR
jgi:hypothetical protein